MEASLGTSLEIARDSMMFAIKEEHLCSCVKIKVVSYLSAKYFELFIQSYVVCLIAKTTFAGTYFHCFHVTFAGFDMHLNLFKFLIGWSEIRWTLLLFVLLRIFASPFATPTCFER